MSTVSLARGLLATAIGAFALLWSGDIPRPGEPATLVATAEARIGRPATPMSYAGVARRTTRRAVAVGAATTRCVQVVNSYGQVSTVCR